MTFLRPAGGPGLGFFPWAQSLKIINGIASPLPVGRCVVLDFELLAPTRPALNFIEGDDRSAYAIAKLPVPAHLTGSLMTLMGVVVDSPIAVGGEGRVQIFGDLSGEILTASGSTAANRQLTINTSGQFVTAAAGQRIFACAHAAWAAAGQHRMLFNGFAGLFCKLPV